jgi:hypothetical protein
MDSTQPPPFNTVPSLVFGGFWCSGILLKSLCCVCVCTQRDVCMVLSVKIIQSKLTDIVSSQLDIVF